MITGKILLMKSSKGGEKFVFKGWLSNFKKIKLIDIIKPRSVTETFRLLPKAHINENQSAVKRGDIEAQVLFFRAKY